MRRWVQSTGACLLLWCAGIVSAAAQERAIAPRTVQSAAVLALYPSLPIQLDTPALKPGRTTFTTQGELESFVDDLQAGDIWFFPA